MIIESLTNQGAVQDKLVLTWDYAWEVTLLDSGIFNVRVRFDDGISVWDTQFFRLNDSGKIETINWSEDWSQLSDLSDEQLRLVRNKVFAKYGYIFNSEDLSNYFSRFQWYQPQFENVDSLLTEDDKNFINHLTNLSNSKS